MAATPIRVLSCKEVTQPYITLIGHGATTLWEDFYMCWHTGLSWCAITHYHTLAL